MKIVKSCSVNFRPEAIYLNNHTNTPYGLIANVPFTILSRDVDPALLGKALLDLLESIPETFTEVDLAASGMLYLQHLNSLGFKTVNAFEKKAQALSVKVVDEKIAVVPFEPTPDGGYLAATGRTKYCSFEAEALGKLVFEQNPKEGQWGRI